MKRREPSLCDGSRVKWERENTDRMSREPPEVVHGSTSAFWADCKQGYMRLSRQPMQLKVATPAQNCTPGRRGSSWVFLCALVLTPTAICSDPRPLIVPSPGKLALASLQLGVTASASGCGWGEGTMLRRLPHSSSPFAGAT